MSQEERVRKRVKIKTSAPKKSELSKAKKDVIIYGVLILLAIVALFLIFLFLDKATGSETRI